MWLGPMEAITIQIATSVIKEMLEEDSSELILPQNRQGNGEKKGIRQTVLHAAFSFPGQKIQATGQCGKTLPVAGVVFTTWAISGHPDCKMKHTGLPSVPLLTQGEAGSQPLTAGTLV